MTPPSQSGPRRILMTTDAVGGVWNYALELCQALQSHDVDVLLATMGPAPRPEQRAAATALGNVTLRESTFRLEWMDTPWDDVARAGDWLLGLTSSFAPGLIHLNGYTHAALPWRAPTIVVAHSCVLSWWRAVRHCEPPPEWNRYRERVSAGVHAADLVIAPTRAMLDALAQHYGRPAASIVIPNGRAADAYSRGPAKEPFIFSVGRLWDEAKNAAALAAVAPQLAWPVRLAGELSGPGGAPRTWTSVETLGRCTSGEVACLYRRAAIYALPARYEPFGLSVLEAALAGCALVLGDIPSLRENWDGAAVFVAPDDRAGLRNAINALIAQPARRHRLAAAARQRAGRFSVDRMIARYLQVYRGVAAGDTLARASNGQSAGALCRESAPQPAVAPAANRVQMATALSA